MKYSHQIPRFRLAGAFTLIELLVVIGILTLLMAILLPLLSKARIAAYVAGTKSRINNLTAVIEQYYSTYGAYPGPLPDNELITSTTIPNYSGTTNVITSTENCLLGLLGGWVPTGFSTPKDANGGFNPGNVGAGPVFFNTGQQGLPIGEFGSLGVLPQPWVSVASSQASATPLFTGIVDTSVPEFTDAFPYTAPEPPAVIIYMRARVGAGGMADPTTNAGQMAQYDLGQMSPYLTCNTTSGGNYTGNAPYGPGTFPDPTAFPPYSQTSYVYQKTSKDVYVQSDTVSNLPAHKDHFMLIAASAPLGGAAGYARRFGSLSDIRN